MTRSSHLGFVSAGQSLKLGLDTVSDPDRVVKVADDAVQLIVHVANRLGNSGLDHLELMLESLAETADEPITATSTLTTAERADLIASGAFTEEALAETEAQIAAGELDRLIAQTRQGVILDSLSADEVSALLQRSPSRVSHRVAEPSLYSFQVGRSRRFPKWQFTATGELPGLARIVPAIPEGTHPASVDGFMRNPSPALVVQGDVERSPVDWLTEGGLVDDVVEILQQWAWR